MSDDLPILIGVILALLASAGFSGAEMVFLTLDRLRLHTGAVGGSRAARRVEYFALKPERFVVTSLTGNNLANVIYSSLVALLLTRHGISEQAILLVSPLGLLVLGEALPKALGRQFANHIDRVAATFLSFTRVLLRPLVWGVERSVSTLQRWFSLPSKPVGVLLSRADLAFALTDAKRAGGVSEGEARLIRRLLALSERKVAEVMTPRTRVATIQLDAPVREAVRLVGQSGNKRLVCYGHDEDDLLGVIRAADLLQNPADLRAILRPVPIVPESLPTIRLIEWLRRNRTHFALAIDEYGGFAGVVTVTDLASELVGPIHDVHQPPGSDIIRLSDRIWLAAGRVKLSHLAEMTGFEPSPERAVSVSGLLVELANGIPAVGDEFEVAGAKLRVIRADPRGVKLVRLVLAKGSRESASLS